MTDRPRMRTAPKAIEELKKLDPDTAFTLRALRRMMSNGEIPVTKIESKRLVNLDTLLSVLANGTSYEASKAENYGKIRRIG